MPELEESSKIVGVVLRTVVLVLTVGSRKHCLDFLGEGERLFHSVFVICCTLLLSVTMAGVFCCTHGKDIMTGHIFNICACSVLQFEISREIY